MGRFARNLMARASGGSVALSRLWPGRTDRLIIAPHDLRTADVWIGDRQRNERDPRPQTAQCRHHEVHRIADQQGNPIPGLDGFYAARLVKS